MGASIGLERQEPAAHSAAAGRVDGIQVRWRQELVGTRDERLQPIAPYNTFAIGQCANHLCCRRQQQQTNAEKMAEEWLALGVSGHGADDVKR